MTSPLLLEAADPAAWVARHLAAHQARFDAPGATGTWLGLADLLADDAAVLRRAHAGVLAAGGATPAAAAKWLAAWFGGGLVEAVALPLAFAGAGLVVEPAQVRWRVVPGGWVDRVDLGPATALVPEGHPWAGRPGTSVAADPGGAALATAAAALAPLVGALGGLARVGPRALWAEVADGAGSGLLHAPRLPVDARACAALAAALRAPGLPWRRVPELRVAATPHGPAYVVRKGGCCLVYQSTPTPLVAHDAAHADFLAAFGADGPAYCSTCSLRTADDCTARQAFLHGQRAEALSRS